MEKTNDEFLFKVCFIGDSMVGKSSIIQRFVSQDYQENFITTIGVDFKLRTIELEGKLVKIQIWDTAGQERFKGITALYYRRVSGIIIVFDITNRRSFENVSSWLKEIERYAEKNVKILLIGNKSDLNDQREVNYEEALELANTLGITFLETSAKQSINIEEAFISMAYEIKNTLDTSDKLIEPPGRINVKPPKIRKKSKKCWRR